MKNVSNLSYILKSYIFYVFMSLTLFLSSSVVYGTNWIPYDKNQKPVLDKNKNNSSIRYWKDIKTSLLWTNANNEEDIVKKWEDAARYCMNLDHAGINSWRLPSYDEFYKAYEDGIFSLNNLEGIGNLDGVFWSLSSTSIYNYYAWSINLSTGKMSPFIKIGDLKVICVK